VKSAPRWYCCGKSHSYREPRCSQCAGKRRQRPTRKRVAAQLQAYAPEGFVERFREEEGFARPWWIYD
jgi:hypothetical protein